MMNIRELVYDDPDESRHELPTINFRKGSAPASSESGEATVTWPLECDEPLERPRWRHRTDGTRKI